jgi:hypothetical protein
MKSNKTIWAKPNITATRGEVEDVKLDKGTVQGRDSWVWTIIWRSKKPHLMNSRIGSMAKRGGAVQNMGIETS